MKKLLKIYEVLNDIDYYNIIIESVINGQREQARKQFNAMPKGNKTTFLVYILFDDESLKRNDKIMFINEI